jgi:uncharacterized Fe-S center protein
MSKSKVYFTKTISPEKMIDMVKILNSELPGKVAIKLHSGEVGNQNFLRPEFMKPVIDYVDGTVVECNTAYEGMRNTTEKHWETMKKHHWTDYFKVDIMDADDEIEIPVNGGAVIQKNYVGANFENYDSMLVLSHFKGHPMGGYGGALKQLSIGIASSKGKRYIHCVGKENGSYEDMFKVDQISFLESMVDAAKSVVDYFKDNIVYINIMCNMSVDCDCCSNAKAPCMKDIGILSSIDPVALDKACIDLVYNSNDLGKNHLIERIESKHGTHIIEVANQLKIGSIDYELIEIK